MERSFVLKKCAEKPSALRESVPWWGRVGDESESWMMVGCVWGLGCVWGVGSGCVWGVGWSDFGPKWRGGR